MLTRGQAPTGMNAAQIDFRPFLTVDAGWDNGLNGVSIDPNGNPVNVSGVSVDASLGLSGLRCWGVRGIRAGPQPPAGYSSTLLHEAGRWHVSGRSDSEGRTTIGPTRLRVTIQGWIATSGN